MAEVTKKSKSVTFSKTNSKVPVSSKSKAPTQSKSVTPSKLLSAKRTKTVQKLYVPTKASKLFRPPVRVVDTPTVSISSKTTTTNNSQNTTVVLQNERPEEGQTRKMKRDKKMKEEQELRKSRHHRTVQYLSKRTHFDSEQIKSLLDMFKALTAASPMDRQKFRQLLHTTFGMNNNTMLDRIFNAFDGDNLGTVSESEWVMGLSVMIKGSFDEKIRFRQGKSKPIIYEIYDVNGDNNIGRDDVHNCLRGCFRPVAAVPNEDEDDFQDFEKEIVELAMRKLDIDRDGAIQIGDFHQAVYSNPLLLQSLGPCLPSEKTTKAFLAVLDINYEHFFSGLSVPGDIGWDHCRHNHGSQRNAHAHHHHNRPQNLVSVFDRKKRNILFDKSNAD